MVILVLLPALPAAAEPVRGAGSTFAAPVISAWGKAYKEARADGGDYFTLEWSVDYEPVGSLAGVMRLSQPEMDFAATDAPLSPEEVAKRNVAQFPIVMGGIAVVANVAGVEPGKLRLNGPVLADVFSGKVKSWSDPAIVALNPDIRLPDRPIKVLRRKDGSGSTFVFTSYLSKTSSEWRQKFGAATLIDWAVGQGAEGTANLVALAAATSDGITYLEYGQVTRAGLPIVQLQNEAGVFVAPAAESFASGLANIAWDASRHFFADTTKMPGAGAYPMVAVTYAVMPKDRGIERTQRVIDLFRLAYSAGASEARALGYTPVSPELARQIDRYWSQTLTNLNN
ncbi:phosphate ABC transporter substrate-binding protein PstS [Mesorhizobium loti]|nr:phosphate ABC transporter substrate-binding protein PstS [Mesorhizobium loti]